MTNRKEQLLNEYTFNLDDQESDEKGKKRHVKQEGHKI